MVTYFHSESLYKLDVELGHLGMDWEAFKPIYFLLLQVEQLDQYLHVYFVCFYWVSCILLHAPSDTYPQLYRNSGGL